MRFHSESKINLLLSTGSKRKYIIISMPLNLVLYEGKIESMGYNKSILGSNRAKELQRRRPSQTKRKRRRRKRTRRGQIEIPIRLGSHDMRQLRLDNEATAAARRVAVI